jgi:hypothetical protein
MIIFLWVLAAMGVAYWAKVHGRKAGIWFVLAIILTPLGASVLLMLSDRFGVRF